MERRGSSFPENPLPEALTPDFRVVVDDHGPVIISVPNDGSLADTPSIRSDAPVVAVSGGRETPVDFLDATDIGRTAGLVFDENGDRVIVSPTPMTYLVIRVQETVAASLGDSMEHVPENEVLSASPSYTMRLPDNFSLLPIRNTVAIDDEGNWQYSGQLVGMLRSACVHENLMPAHFGGPPPETRPDAAQRLGWLTRRYSDDTQLRLSGSSWTRSPGHVPRDHMDRGWLGRTHTEAPDSLSAPWTEPQLERFLQTPFASGELPSPY
jgi:hypothetical protein